MPFQEFDIKCPHVFFKEHHWHWYKMIPGSIQSLIYSGILCLIIEHKWYWYIRFIVYLVFIVHSSSWNWIIVFMFNLFAQFLLIILFTLHTAPFSPHPHILWCAISLLFWFTSPPPPTLPNTFDLFSVLWYNYYVYDHYVKISLKNCFSRRKKKLFRYKKIFWIFILKLIESISKFDTEFF